MSDLEKEISELADYFNELDLQVQKATQKKSYKKWRHTQLAKNQVYETREVKVVLWKNTSKERVAYQKITKFVHSTYSKQP